MLRICCACDKDGLLLKFIPKSVICFRAALTCDCRSSILESRLSLLTAIAPAEHPSDTFSPRHRSKTVDEDEAEWTLEVVKGGDGCCEVVTGGRLVMSLVNASGELCSWWGNCCSCCCCCCARTAAMSDEAPVMLIICLLVQ